MNIIDILSEIEEKKTSWQDLSEEFKKSYSQFVINRFISSKNQYLPIIASMTCMKLTNEQHYTMLCSIVKSQKHYFNMKAYKKQKNIDELTLFAMMHEFNISEREAMQYAEMMSKIDVDALINKWKELFDIEKNL